MMKYHLHTVTAVLSCRFVWESPWDAWCSLKWKEHPCNHSLFPHCQCSIQMTLHGTHTSVIALRFLSQLFEKGQLLTTKKKCPAFLFWLFIWFELWRSLNIFEAFLENQKPNTEKPQERNPSSLVSPILTPISTSVNRLWILDWRSDGI